MADHQNLSRSAPPSRSGLYIIAALVVACIVVLFTFSNRGPGMDDVNGTTDSMVVAPDGAAPATDAPAQSAPAPSAN